MMNLNLSSASRMGLNLLALLGVAMALYLGESIFIPLTIAVMLAAILYPFVKWLNEKLRFPWTMACFVAVGLLLTMFGAVTLGFVLAVPKMLQDLPNPNRPDEQQRLYSDFRRQVMKVSFTDVNPVLPETAEDSRLFNYVRDFFKSEYVNRALLRLAMYLQSWLLQLVLVMFVILFLLMEGRMLTQRIVEIFGPSQEAQNKAVDALAQIAESVRSYLVWRTVVNIGLALVLGIVYKMAGLKQAWTWAMLAAVLCYVPYIGTILAGVPPVLDAFIYRSPLTAAGILLFYIIVVTVEGYLIVPLVMGRSMDLNATTVILSCLFWDLVWGTPGLFLAMPLMAALKAVCMSVPGWRPWANLMGTDDRPPPPEPAPVPAVVAAPDAAGDTVLMEDPPVRPTS